MGPIIFKVVLKVAAAIFFYHEFQKHEEKDLKRKPVKDYIESGINSEQVDEMLANDANIKEWASDNDNELLKKAIVEGDVYKAKLLLSQDYISVKDQFFSILKEESQLRPNSRLDFPRVKEERSYPGYYELLNLAIRNKVSKVIPLLLDLETNRLHVEPPGAFDSLFWNNSEKTGLYPKEKLLQTFELLARDGSAETLRTFLSSNDDFYRLLEQPYLGYIFAQALGYREYDREVVELAKISFEDRSKYLFGDVKVNYEVIEEIVRILQMRIVDIQSLCIESLAVLAIRSDNSRVLSLLLDSGLMYPNYLSRRLMQEDCYSLVGSPKATKVLLNNYIISSELFSERSLTNLFGCITTHFIMTEYEIDAVAGGPCLFTASEYEEIITSNSMHELKHSFKKALCNIRKKQEEIKPVVNELIEYLLQFESVIIVIGTYFPYELAIRPFFSKLKEINEVYRAVRNRNFQDKERIENIISPVLLWYYIANKVFHVRLLGERRYLDFFSIESGLSSKLYKIILKHPKWVEWREIIETFILCMNRKVAVKRENFSPIPSELLRIISLDGAYQSLFVSYGREAANRHFPLIKALHSSPKVRHAMVEEVCKR